FFRYCPCIRPILATGDAIKSERAHMRARLPKPTTVPTNGVIRDGAFSHAAQLLVLSSQFDLGQLSLRREPAWQIRLRIGADDARHTTDRLGAGQKSRCPDRGQENRARGDPPASR